MKKIYIIAGISAAGKSTIINEFLITDSSWRLVPKYTTRQVRPNEKGVLLNDNIGGMSPEFMDNCDLIYEWDDNKYGIKYEDLDSALSECDNIVMTAKDPETIRKLCDHYGEKGIITVPIFVVPDSFDNELLDESFSKSSNFIVQNMISDKRTPEEIESRLMNIAEEYERIWRGNEGLFYSVIMTRAGKRYSVIPAIDYAIVFDSGATNKKYGAVGRTLSRLTYGNPTDEEIKEALPVLNHFVETSLPVEDRSIINLSLHLRAQRKISEYKDIGYGRK